MESSLYSTPAQVALALIPKFTSTLSICSSSFIISEVFRDHFRKRRTSSIQRALVGMSIVDICASTAWFLSTWMVPKESDFAFAKGTLVTCNIQGFLLQMAIGAPLYNCSLAIYYLLMIQYNWNDTRIVKIERWVHVLILLFTLGTSIALWPLEQYNHISNMCWTNGSPRECGRSTNKFNANVPCERGDHAWIYGIFLFYGPLWICVFCVVVAMISIYRHVNRTHGRSRQHYLETLQVYHPGSSEYQGGADVRRVAVQAFLYSLSFVITWLPSTVAHTAHWFKVGAFWLDCISAVCEPLQGFWNAVIFIRNRPSSKRRLQSILSMVSCGVLKPWPAVDTFNDSTVLADRSGHRMNHAASDARIDTTTTRVTREAQDEGGVENGETKSKGPSTSASDE